MIPKLKFDIIANIISDMFRVSSRCKEIFKIPDDFLLLYNLQVEFQHWSPDTERKESLQRLTSQIISHFNEINFGISDLNQNLILLNPDLSEVAVKKIRFSKKHIENNLNILFQKIETKKGSSEKIVPHIKNSLLMFLKSLIDSVLWDIKRVVNSISSENKHFTKGIKIPGAYRSKINEVIDLYIFGYKSTSLLVLGKIFEEILTRYLIILIKSKKINLSLRAVKEIKFEHKLNTLSSKGFIPHKDWLLLSKLIWDRNIGGHYVGSKKISDAKKEADSTIKLILPLINKYHNKVHL